MQYLLNYNALDKILASRNLNVIATLRVECTGFIICQRDEIMKPTQIFSCVSSEDSSNLAW